MTIYYWQGATGSDALLKEHAEAIARLLSRDYSHQQLEKLRNEALLPIYSFRLNKADRLLFTTYKGFLHVLEHIENHDYQKSRFLKKGVLAHHLAEEDQKVPSLVFTELDESESKPTFEVSLEAEKPAALEYYNQQSIAFSEPQENILKTTSLPLILNGAAGSGKTLLGLSFLSNALLKNAAEENEGGRFLYVSKEQHLVDAIKAINDDGRGIEFKAYHELFFNGQMGVGYSFFEAWYGDLKEESALVSKTANDVYQEFRVCSGFSAEDYCALGDRQSSIPAGDARRAVYECYVRYLNYLKISETFDPAFSCTITEPTYDLIVVDEAHNLSPGQQRQLAALSKHNAIIYCIDQPQNLVDVSPVRALLKQLFYPLVDVATEHLRQSYRSSQRVTSALNRLLEMRRAIHGGVVDKEETKEIITYQDAPLGELHVITPEMLKDDPQWLSWVSGRLGRLAVVTTAACIAEARQVFKTPLVFTPEQIQGQEYHTIMVYRMLDGLSNTFKKINAKLKNLSTSPNRPKKDTADVENLPFMSAYLTACSRAQDSLCLVEAATSLSKVFLDHLKAVSGAEISPTTVLLPKVSWDEIASEQRRLGNTHIAEQIVEDGLLAKPGVVDSRFTLRRADFKLEQAFLKDVQRGDRKSVAKLLLNTSLDVHYQNEQGFTALMIAAGRGHILIVEKLIKHTPPINLNQTNNVSGGTALCTAAISGQTSTLKLLLEETKTGRVDFINSDLSGISLLLSVPCQSYNEPAALPEDAALRVMALLMDYGMKANLRSVDRKLLPRLIDQICRSRSVIDQLFMDHDFFESICDLFVLPLLSIFIEYPNLVFALMEKRMDFWCFIKKKCLFNVSLLQEILDSKDDLDNPIRLIYCLLFIKKQSATADLSFFENKEDLEINVIKKEFDQLLSAEGCLNHDFLALAVQKNHFLTTYNIRYVLEGYPKQEYMALWKDMQLYGDCYFDYSRVGQVMVAEELDAIMRDKRKAIAASLVKLLNKRVIPSTISDRECIGAVKCICAYRDLLLDAQITVETHYWLIENIDLIERFIRIILSDNASKKERVLEQVILLGSSSSQENKLSGLKNAFGLLDTLETETGDLAPMRNLDGGIFISRPILPLAPGMVDESGFVAVAARNFYL